MNDPIWRAYFSNGLQPPTIPWKSKDRYFSRDSFHAFQRSKHSKDDEGHVLWKTILSFEIPGKIWQMLCWFQRVCGIEMHWHGEERTHIFFRTKWHHLSEIGWNWCSNLPKTVVLNRWVPSCDGRWGGIVKGHPSQSISGKLGSSGIH